MDPALQVGLTSTDQRGRITSLDLLEMPFLMQPGVMLVVFTSRAHCWLMHGADAER